MVLGTVLLIGPANAQVERISVDSSGQQAAGDSYQSTVSSDGTVVAFRSNAANLVAGDTNEWPDIFVRDLTTNSTVRVSLTETGTQTSSYSKAPSISGDGEIVVYEGRSVGVVTVFVHDRPSSTNVSIVPDTLGMQAIAPAQGRVDPVISSDGSIVAFQTDSTLQNAYPEQIRPVNDDMDTAPDIFLYDLQTVPTPAIQRVSRLSNGDSLDGDNRNPTLSNDGRFIAFESFSDLLADDSNNDADILHKDRQSGLLQLVSATPAGTSGNGTSLEPALSADGSLVAFRSSASDLVTGDSNDRLDIFVRDLTSGTTELVSVASDGSQADQNSFEPDLSGDGRYVVFRSNASNLVLDDLNQRTDIFVHDRDRGLTQRVGQPPGGESNGNSTNPSISEDGRWIVFESDASNLVTGDSNRARDIFRAANPLFEATRSGEHGADHE
jgi:Tol biopolymer transport system component